jgi:hypothetical protein
MKSFQYPLGRQFDPGNATHCTQSGPKLFRTPLHFSRLKSTYEANDKDFSAEVICYSEITSAEKSFTTVFIGNYIAKQK